MAAPLIVIDPQPRSITKHSSRRFGQRSERSAKSRSTRGPGRMPAKQFEACLPEMTLLIGQSDMPKARLDRAPKLRAIINIETKLSPERRLRRLLRTRNPCARARLRIRRAGRRDGARNGHRPLSRRHHGGPRDAAGPGEMAARRGGRLLLALRRPHRPHRLRRSRARLHAARRALRLSDQGVRPVGV